VSPSRGKGGVVFGVGIITAKTGSTSSFRRLSMGRKGRKEEATLGWKAGE
jgi:hypothetical protein